MRFLVLRPPTQRKPIKRVVEPRQCDCLITVCHPPAIEEWLKKHSPKIRMLFCPISAPVPWGTCGAHEIKIHQKCTLTTKLDSLILLLFFIVCFCGLFIEYFL